MNEHKPKIKDIKFFEIRMSSDGYGNAQGHYIQIYGDRTVYSLIEEAKQYVENYSNYTLKDIQVQLWRNTLGDSKIPNYLIDWYRIGKMYPKMTIGELIYFAYDGICGKDKYSCLTLACTLPYWDGNKHTWKKAISLEGEY